jgi:hypothetical protein
MSAIVPIKNYSGAAKVALAFNSAPMMAEGENGAIKLAFDFKRTMRSTGSEGYLLSTLDDAQAKLTLTPFDSWTLLPTLFPPYLGVTTAVGTGYAAGALKIGSRPHDIYAGNVPNGCALAQVWTIDQRMYNIVRSAITKHPTLKLGVGVPLFSDIEITGLADPALALGAGGEIIDTAVHVAGIAGTTGVVESAAVDPASWVPDFINGHWTGVYGTAAGFGGDGVGVLPMDAEDGWELVPSIKYSPLLMQKRTYHMKLDSVMFAVKARIQGPTHTLLMSMASSFAQGAGIMGAALGSTGKALVLTGPGGKMITLPDCVPIFDNSGFEFGGTKLNTGEVLFVTRAIPTGSPAVAPVLLQFSA